MNGKLAKKIRKLSKIMKPDVENETDYSIRKHQPRFLMRTIVDPETGFQRMEPFRVNTDQNTVSLECRRGIYRLMKKQYNYSKRAVA